MHKGLYWVVGIWLALAYLLMGSDRVKAETTFFSDSKGNQVGSAYQLGNTTYYQDSRGNPVGNTICCWNTTCL